MTEEVLKLKEEGLSNKEIGDKLGVTHQKVSQLIKGNEAVETEVLIEPTGIITRTAQEYMDFSKSMGRTAFGGKKGKKVKATKEELRALINSNWSPSMVMEKWQFEEADLISLVHVLSKAELRDKPIGVNFKVDRFI